MLSFFLLFLSFPFFLFSFPLLSFFFSYIFLSFLPPLILFFLFCLWDSVQTNIRSPSILVILYIRPLCKEDRTLSVPFYNYKVRYRAVVPQVSSYGTSGTPYLWEPHAYHAAKILVQHSLWSDHHSGVAFYKPITCI